MPGILLDENNYQKIDDEVRIAITYLLKVRDRLGITDDAVLEGKIKEANIKNKVIRRYAVEIYKVWAGLCPGEHKEFIKNTEFDLKYERPVKEAVKAGGYSPLAYPMRLNNLYGILLPKIKIQDKRFWMPLLREIPELRRTNYLK